MKISVFSFATNDKFPLAIMYRQFIKYMKEEDFNFILFNDARDQAERSNINIIASHNGMQSIDVPQGIHGLHDNMSMSPSASYASTLNWAIHDYANNNGYEIIALMHSDVLPIYDVSLSKIIGKHVIASTMERRTIGGQCVRYLYPAFTIINMKLLKRPDELDFGTNQGMDVGANTMNFLKDNTDVKTLVHHQASHFIKMLDENQCPMTYCHKDNMVKYYKEDIAITIKYGLNSGWICNGFYHYLAGSQWNSENNPRFAQGHKERMDLFLRYFY